MSMSDVVRLSDADEHLDKRMRTRVNSDAALVSINITQEPRVVLVNDEFVEDSKENDKAQENGQVLEDDPDKDHLLQMSIYEERPHLLDLRTLDTPNRLMAKALTIMTNLTPAYATGQYDKIFNWPEIVDRLRTLTGDINYKWPETSFYVVVFRSQVPPRGGEDRAILDKAAHAEAVKSGGFLKYWFGEPDKDYRNLATCIWRSPQDAKKGSEGKDHKKAAQATRSLYTEWAIQRLRLTIKDEVADWTITDW